MSFLEELKRRNVVRVGVAYVVFAWVLLQIFDVIGEILELPAWGGKMILVALLLGLPLALIFAWVFEMTPEGIKREREIDRSQSVTRSTGRKLNFVTMVLMAVALAWFAWDKFGAGPAGLTTTSVDTVAAPVKPAPPGSETSPAATAVAAHSIAVLPFVDMSPSKDQEYLSDGIAEELLNLLVKIPGLQVAARTSSFSFKGKDVKIADVARELHVANVLEGSVRKSGNQVRITAQLIQADSGFHLYSETFDRTLDDVFGIQDEISAAVVEALEIKLLGAAPKAVQVDPRAYALYLQGRYFYGRRTQADWEKATRAYQDALEIDSGYAAAWAGLARVYYSRAGQSYTDLHQGTAQARQAAQKALALQPTLSEGYVSLAAIQMTYDWDWAGSEASLQRALELTPGMADAMANLGILKRYVGDLDEAIELDRRAVALDPLNLPGYHALGLALIYAGRLDEADEVYQHLLTLNPEFSAANLARSRVRLLQGQPDEALAVAELETEPFWREFGVLSALYVLGRTAEADARLVDFIAQNQNDSAYQIAQLYGFRDDQDKVFEWLERAYVQRDGGLPEMLLDPYLRTFSDDPRWPELVKKVGLHDAWLKQRDI
jgi:TolB-like protein/tetratricopeptide (TPR) repeat protein